MSCAPTHLRSAGLNFEGPILADGKLKRFLMTIAFGGDLVDGSPVAAGSLKTSTSSALYTTKAAILRSLRSIVP
jgi:hypothetical protein